MIPKIAIERAIEGGWRPADIMHTGNLIADTKFMQQQATLDPDFWQSLAKALGWVVTKTGQAPYIPVALHFYDLILTGGDTEAFWADLLAPRNQ